MQRTILLFLLAMFCTALLNAAISVYLFHDVDKDQMGKWNEAFGGLCGEMVLFTLVIGAGVTLLTWIGRLLLRLKGYSPRTRLGLVLGVAVSVLQYPWDIVGRAISPNLADIFLSVYLIFAILVCSFAIVRDNFRQMKLRQGHAASFEG